MKINIAEQKRFNLCLSNIKDKESVKIEILEFDKNHGKFQYYYRRGNKYFLRNDDSKIIFTIENTNELVQLKFGEFYKVDYN